MQRLSWLRERLEHCWPSALYITLGIAIPDQFPNSGILDWRGRDPGIPELNAHVIRDSNPGPTFSIPGFGIETFLMPGSPRDYGTRLKTIITQPRASHTVHNSHTDGCGPCDTYVIGWYCSILDAKQARKKLNNVRKTCNGTLLSSDCTAYMIAVLKML
jgi:hypothetical protein